VSFECNYFPQDVSYFRGVGPCHFKLTRRVPRWIALRPCASRKACPLDLASCFLASIAFIDRNLHCASGPHTLETLSLVTTILPDCWQKPWKHNTAASEKTTCDFRLSSALAITGIAVVRSVSHTWIALQRLTPLSLHLPYSDPEPEPDRCQ
jgi:hypothetical protein